MSDQNYPSQVQSIPQALTLAVQYHQAGQLAQAKDIYQQILQYNPHHVDALYLLGTLFFQNNEAYQTSADLIGKAIELDPNFAEAHNNLGNTLKALGQSDQAIASYRKAIELKPNYAEAYSNLADILKDSGEREEAITNYWKAINLNPNLIGTYTNLGNLLQQQEQLNEALRCYQALIKQKPNFAPAYNNIGNLYQRLKQPENATANYQKAIEINPNYAEAHYNFANLLKEIGHPNIAVPHYQKAISLKPDFIQAYQNLGSLLTEKGQLDSALSYYQKILEIQPNSFDTYNNIANTVKLQGQLDLAIQYHKQALQIQPDSVETYNSIANILKSQGKLQEAKTYYKKAINIEPDSPISYYNLAEQYKFTAKDKYFLKLLELSESNDIPSEKRKYIYFALYKAWKDLGDDQKAFVALERGNQLKRQEIDYSITAELKYLNQIKEWFTPEIISQKTLNVESSRVPIFVLGMPRSGTTLVEQILSSHSEVAGLGELRFIGYIVSENLEEISNLELLDESDLKQLRTYYLEEVAKLDNQSTYFVDKMPGNFLYIGLIKLLFPEAKILHCTRNPLDNCLSLYEKLFTQGQNYTYNLQELGEYYLGYRQLMQHWYQTLPNFIYTVRYEDIIANQEEESKKLIDFCNLDWQDNILQFFANKRAVRTASTLQVRQKLYNTSINKWKKYATQLAELEQFFKEHQVI